MNLSLVCFAVALVAPMANAADPSPPKDPEARYGAMPLKGDYYVYGGSMGDMVPPTAKDRVPNAASGRRRWCTKSTFRLEGSGYRR